MAGRFKGSLLAASWKFPFARTFSSRAAVVLIYHGIPAKGDGTFVDAKVLESHIECFKTYFKLISPDKLREKRRATDKVRVLLTFDDGFRNNAEVVAPILRRHQVPALFFVCSRHSVPGRYLWFSYLRALEQQFPRDGFRFRGEFMDMSSNNRTSTIRRLRKTLLSLMPHPAAMYEAIDEELPRLESFVNGDALVDNYAGMTEKHVRDLAADPLFSIGAHTFDHPFLTKSNPEEAIRQISDNKDWIEQVTQKRCDAIAYPIGDYDERILEHCQKIGFTQGFAQTPKLAVNGRLEIPRLGIYSTALNAVAFKAQWGRFIRQFGLNVG